MSFLPTADRSPAAVFPQADEWPGDEWPSVSPSSKVSRRKLNYPRGRQPRDSKHFLYKRQQQISGTLHTVSCWSELEMC